MRIKGGLLTLGPFWPVADADGPVASKIATQLLNSGFDVTAGARCRVLP